MRRAMMLAAGAVVLASIGVAAGTPQQPAPYNGSADFQAFCASCHGQGGKGDGAIAASLRTRPADLTQLSKKHDGVFPADAVFKVIESGHENADMPAWSAVLAKSQESTGSEAAKARIRELVKYLETIQPKP